MPRFNPYRTLSVCLAVLAATVAVLWPWSPALAERRVALVVGNGSYRNAATLGNPANDATAMAAALEAVGFEVVDGGPVLDLDKVGLEQAINRFGNAIRGADTALFYYSGHGIQVDGANYLIPVTAAVDYKKDVKYQLVDAGFVLDEMQTAGTTTNIVILDACRINPFNGANFRAPVAGLAHMDAPKGSLIAYSTAPGRTARDGDGRNSPYTEALARHIPTPGVRIEDVFMRVRQDVDRLTNGAQSPWEAYNLYSPFYFVPPTQAAGSSTFLPDGAPGSAIPAQAAGPDKETLLWQTIAAENDPTVFEDYLRRYPEGGFAAVAKSKLDRLKPKAPPPPKAGDLFRDPATGMEFVWVEGGCFAMGSPDRENGRYEDEGPVHEVCVDGFWMGRYEVTNGQYRNFMPAHDSRSFSGHGLNGDNQPAAYVSWEDARAFAAWLGTKGGGTYRLPTEAEWEYAARGGTASSRFWGDSPDNGCGYANGSDLAAGKAFQWSKMHACDDGFAVSAPVGSFKPNPFGLYDMLGNVREWCQDAYGERAYLSGQRANPVYTGGSAGRVNRGGSWSLSPRDVRSANRKGNLPGETSCDLGFRLVRMP